MARNELNNEIDAGKIGEKNRGRRSLTSAYFSNFELRFARVSLALVRPEPELCRLDRRGNICLRKPCGCLFNPLKAASSNEDSGPERVKLINSSSLTSLLLTDV